MASLVPLCRLNQPDGRTCHSPALRHQKYCYFHEPAHRTAGPRLRTTRPGYHWYGLQRRTSILQQEELPGVITGIVNALFNGEIPLRRARKLLKAMNERSCLLHRCNQPAAPEL